MRRATNPVSGGGATRVSREQVAAFRLARHHLMMRAPAAAAPSVAADMAGAQAQVLSAGQLSIWARLRAARAEDLEAALWRDRTLVRAWCMRRTLFIVPSDELAVFARGTSRRSEYNYSWAVERVASKQQLDRLLDDVLESLDEPRTRSGLAQALKSQGYKIKSKAGGGWGDRSNVPWVEAGGASFSVGFILHAVGARGVICSGPSVGNESTYVRADRWAPRWKDMPVEEAEGELLVKYLRAFGPATVADFALWMGLYMRDAKELWPRVADRIAQVDMGGRKAAILESDLQELESARIGSPVVRLLPFFDTFILGHKSHEDIVDERHRRRVYRAQGWISPVLLVNGRAHGTWSYAQRKDSLEVRVTPFATLSRDISSQLREEASDLGRFFGCQSVTTRIA